MRRAYAGMVTKCPAGDAAAPPARRLLLLEGDGDVELDFVRYHRDAETDAEVRPLDRGFAFEADSQPVRRHHRIAGAGELGVERDRLGHPVQRQVAGDLGLVAADG